MKKLICFSLLSLFLLCGCDFSENDDEGSEDKAEQDKNFQTNLIAFQMRLDIDAEIIDKPFNQNDITSYNTSIVKDLCRPDGLKEEFEVFFVKQSATEWLVHFSIEEELVNIDKGIENESGVLAAELLFDDAGTFVHQTPYRIFSEEQKQGSVTYEIELDFYTAVNLLTNDLFDLSDVSINGC